MKTLLWIVTTGILMYSCSGSHKMSNKKSGHGTVTESGNSGSTGKAKASYKSNKYHPSINHHNKIPNVITDKSLKNSSHIKRANHSSSSKYKSKQAAYLKSLNSGSQYKNSKKNDAIFILY
jgi:hypothetical protein